MSFKILYNDNLIYAPNGAEDGFVVSSAKLYRAVNVAGTFTFTIYEEHPHYSSIAMRSGVVKVVDEQWNTVFLGRVIRDTQTYDRAHEIECEGRLACLNDTLMQPHLVPEDYSEDADYLAAVQGGTVPRWWLNVLLTKHNDTCGHNNNKIYLGSVTVGGNALPIEQKEWSTVWECVKNELTDGVLIPRYVGNMIYLDYLVTTTVENTQEIVQGLNLLDIKMEDVGEDYITAVVPLGEKNEDGERLTCSDAADRIIIGEHTYQKIGDTVYSTVLRNRMGNVIRHIEFDEETTAEGLVTKAVEYLDAHAWTIPRTIDISVVDLSYTDSGYDPFEINKFVRLVIPSSGVNETFPLVKLEVDLLTGDVNTTLEQTEVGISGQVAAISSGAGSQRNSSGGSVPPSATLPIVDGTAAVGVENAYARGDHIHPSDTTRIAVTEKGAAGGVASLDSTGKVPLSQLPAGSAQNVYYGTCSTAAGTTYKQITVTGLDSYDDIVAGIVLVVRCATANTTEPYLYINSIDTPFQINISGASGTLDDADYAWDAGAVVEFFCTGSAFLMLPHASTTGWGLTKLHDGINSDSTKEAATANSVMSAAKLGIPYGRCTTAGATQAKTVTLDTAIPGGALYRGMSIHVWFQYAQLYNGAPTLNVNGLGAKSIYVRNGTSGNQILAGLNEWQSGEVVELVYSGAAWIIDGGARRGSKFATLWTNSSPTTAFAAQTITGISPSDYDLIMIEYAQSTGSASPRMSEIVAYSSGRKTWLSYMDAEGGLFGAFRAATLYASSIEFSDCYDEAEATHNGQCVPTAVIGIKF